MMVKSKNIFSLKLAEKKNIHPGPEKQYCYKKECNLCFSNFIQRCFIIFYFVTGHNVSSAIYRPDQEGKIRAANVGSTVTYWSTFHMLLGVIILNLV